MAPVGKQPLKAPFHNASFQDRLQMVALAVAGEEKMEACDIDAPRQDDQPNYTVDTLKKLREKLEPATKLFFLMGADSLHSFRKWQQAEELLFTAEFVIAARPGFSLSDLAAALPAEIKISESQKESCIHTLLLANDSGAQSHLYLLPDLHEDISATEVRTALKEGNEEQIVVPKPVLEYIRAKRLYR